MLLFFLLLLAPLSQAQDYKIVDKGTVQIEKPAFLTMEGSTLFVSSFKFLGADHIFSLASPKGVLAGQMPTIRTLTDKISWPNEVKFLDSSFLGTEGYLISSGFLVPTKSTGAISFLESATGKIITLTEAKKGYFYHRAVFADVTGTGRLDIISARGKISPSGKDGELIWLQRPAQPLKQKWNEVVLAKGPDIHFRVFLGSKKEAVMVITAEFSKKRLGLYKIDRKGSVESAVIDDTLGAPFDLDFYDLNNDGHLDLLVTNHRNDAGASVFAYEIPSDLMHGKWNRHTLLTGIVTRQKGFNQASPGIAKAFYPEVAKAGQSKPWILVSGDGSQQAYLLTPKSQKKDDWSYDSSVILDVKSTVGEPIIGDFDGDGLVDIIIPAYDTNKLYFLSLVGK